MFALRIIFVVVILIANMIGYGDTGPILEEKQNVLDKRRLRSVSSSPTWDSVTNGRIAKLDSRVQGPARAFINTVANQKPPVYLRVTDGFRSRKEQNDLYAKGRTKGGSIVTNAKACESLHNYGLAIDVVVMENKVTPDYSKPLAQNIANIGKQAGFSWGGDWSSSKDYPHFEMTFGQTWQQLFNAGKCPK